MRGKWAWAAVCLILLAVAGLVWLTRRHSTAAVEKSAVAVDIHFTGTVRATSFVDVPAPISGMIERFMADTGEDVFEGELLARIKSPHLEAAAQKAEAEATSAGAHVADLEAAVIAARLEASRSRADATRAQAEFDLAGKTYQRQKLLLDQGATPRLVFEKAEAEYQRLKGEVESFGKVAANAEIRIGALGKELNKERKVAEAKAQALDEAKADLGAGEVHSPVNGVVIERHGQSGDAVNAEMKDLFRIATDLTSLQIVAAPDSKLLTKIKAGEAAAIQIPEARGEIRGTVREVKNGQVVIDFTSPLPAIKPGLSAEVKIPAA